MTRDIHRYRLYSIYPDNRYIIYIYVCMYVWRGDCWDINSMIGSSKRKLLGFSQKDGGEKQHDVCSAISVSVWKGWWYMAKGANLPAWRFGVVQTWSPWCELELPLHLRIKSQLFFGCWLVFCITRKNLFTVHYRHVSQVTLRKSTKENYTICRGKIRYCSCVQSEGIKGRQIDREGKEGFLPSRARGGQVTTFGNGHSLPASWDEFPLLSITLRTHFAVLSFPTSANLCL